MNEKQTEIANKAIEKWGIEAQLDMVIEEAAEVIQACNKLKRTKGDPEYTKRIFDFAEEISDLRMLLDSMENYFKLKAICNEFYEVKFDRLEKRLDE